ncbi:MAG: ribonuclease P protein component [Acidobacteriota bacterium]
MRPAEVRPVGVRPAEALPAAERLKRRPDFLRCYRRGRRFHGDQAILYAVSNDLGHPRLGITASRKVGKAVVRQRIKRRIREIYRRWHRRSSLPAVDLVVHLKAGVGPVEFHRLRGELQGLMRRVIRKPPPSSA